MNYEIESLISILAEAGKKLEAVEAVYSDRKSTLERLKSDVFELGQEIALLEKVGVCLQQINSTIMSQSVELIDKLITSGLVIVFPDQILDFKTRVVRERGRTAIKFDLYQNGTLLKLQDACGGGVLCVIGILLRVVTILMLGMKRVLFLDESLSHLSIQYIPNAAKLLQKICKELGFTILMVTHQPEFTSFADRHYEACLSNGLQLKKKEQHVKEINPKVF